MNRHSTKRPRETSSSSSSSISSSFSSSAAASISVDVIHERSSSSIGSGKKRHLDGGNGQDRQAAPPGGGLFDLDLSFGVFDFPWLKDGLIYSKSDDWKFEDVFFTSFFDGASSTVVDTTSTLTIETVFTELSGKLLWCNLPDPWEEEYEAGASPSVDGGGQAGEGMDCVWNSLLNQPLQRRSSAL